MFPETGDRKKCLHFFPHPVLLSYKWHILEKMHSIKFGIPNMAVAIKTYSSVYSISSPCFTLSYILSKSKNEVGILYCKAKLQYSFFFKNVFEFHAASCYSKMSGCKYTHLSGGKKPWDLSADTGSQKRQESL